MAILRLSTTTLLVTCLIALSALSVRHVMAEDDDIVSETTTEKTLVDDTDKAEKVADEFANVDDEEEITDKTETKIEPMEFESPDKPVGEFYFADAFRDQSGIGRKWIVSTAKKDGAEEALAKYDGQWSISTLDTPVLKDDFGLILKSKAHHHAIATKLNRPFVFSANKPLIVQYDVQFQDGQECGGAYVKLLPSDPDFKLEEFHDKTPYSIMFGPDKCGLTSKIHLIFRYKNPISGKFEEKHAKQPEKVSDSIFTDKKAHLFTLVLNTDNSYEVLVDQSVVMKGNLLESLEPAIMPVKEVDDPEDKKPEDWDEREKIPDPDAVKPEDWDEEAPEYIEDPKDVKPTGWLDDEEEYIPDPTAVKPDDWDEDMDGKWEPAQIKNPKCEEAPGCGKYTPKQIKNPVYKGKWKAPLIKNENFKGKWKPRKIDNPDYFEEKQPFLKLANIGFIGLELWSMSSGIVFDDFLITHERVVADDWAMNTWAVKQKADARYANKSSLFGSLLDAAGERPWLWAVYVLVPLVPLVLIVYFCCIGGSKDEEDIGELKKSDAVLPDDEDAEYNEEMDEPLEEVEPEAAVKLAAQAEAKAASGSPSPPRATTKDDLEASSGSGTESETEQNGGSGDAGTGSPKASPGGSGTRRRPRRE